MGTTHDIAQEYEFEFTKIWTRDNYKRLRDAINNNREFLLDFDVSLIDWKEEFFDGNQDEFLRFAYHVKNKKCLEIGSGACGALAQWVWIKHRTIIEPLLDKINEFMLEEFDYTWYDNRIKKYSHVAERFVPELDNAVDGFIICRNVLDHTAEPYSILENISLYAKEGCYLLLWNDLYHLDGPDDGHFNITKDVIGWKKTIQDHGFEIISEYIMDKNTINYGCRAIKI